MENIKRIIIPCFIFIILLPAESISQTYQSPFDEPSNPFFELILYLSLYPLVGNYYMEDHLYNNLTDYPYQYGQTGNYINSDDSEIRYFRVDMENHTLFSNNNNYGDHFKIKVRLFQYFYLQSDFFQIVEFNRASDFPSHSVLNISFCYDRLRFQKFNLGWAVGMSYVGNRTKKAGISGGFNAEWFFLKCLSLQSSVRWSRHSVDNFESQFRYHHKRILFSVGYETIKVISPRFHFLTAGVGVYL